MFLSHIRDGYSPVFDKIADEGKLFSVLKSFTAIIAQLKKAKFTP